MSWLPGRGRPVAIPHDRTPLRGRSIDTRARVAWLLRINRLAYSPGPASDFVKKLRDHGCILGSSTLCRYETGSEPVPLLVIRAYELALGLPPGQLVGACGGLERVFGSAIAAEPDADTVLTRAELIAALSEWESRIAGGSMHGMDWIRLAEVMCCRSELVLPPSVMHSWAATLATETVRSVREAYTTRSRALGLMLADVGIGRRVLQAIEEVTRAPGAQSVTRVLALLGGSSDPTVTRWLIKSFWESEGEHQWGAAYGLLLQVCRGTLSGDLVPLVSDVVLHAAGEGLDRGLPAFMLAQRLSAELTQQVVARLGCYPAPTGAGARVQSPAGLRHYRAAALLESGLDDPMLDRLLREALSPDFVERRHHSSLLLAASPYRDILADVALGLLSNPTEPYVEDSASNCLGYLAGGAQRAKLMKSLATLPRRRGTVLRALAQCGGVSEAVDLTAYLTEPEEAGDVVYAAGMSDHSALRVLAASEDLPDPGLQRAAQWWRRIGPAVTDDRRCSPDLLDLLHLAG